MASVDVPVAMGIVGITRIPEEYNHSYRESVVYGTKCRKDLDALKESTGVVWGYLCCHDDCHPLGCNEAHGKILYRPAVTLRTLGLGVVAEFLL